MGHICFFTLFNQKVEGLQHCRRVNTPLGHDMWDDTLSPKVLPQLRKYIRKHATKAQELRERLERRKARMSLS